MAKIFDFQHKAEIREWLVEQALIRPSILIWDIIT